MTKPAAKNAAGNAARKAIQPPKDKIWGAITGHALALKAGRLNYMYTCMKQYGDFLEMFIGKRRTLCVNDPEGIRYVLLDNAKNYPKNTPGYQLVSEVLGMGVFTDVGEDWRKGRRVIQPTFNPSKFDRYLRIVSQETEATLARMKKEMELSSELNMSKFATAYPLHVIGRSLFDETLEESFLLISKNLSHLIDLTEKKMTYFTKLQTPAKKKLKKDFEKTLGELDAEVARIIEREKKKEKNVTDNMVHALLESPENFSDEKILSQVKTMIFAGHETTANVLMWSFYFLAQHPEWQQKIFDEGLEKNFAYTGEADLASYRSLDWFIKETMRMRPPAWSFGRIAIEDDMIHGEKVKTGDLISLSPFLIQHHPDYWEKPEEFLPERFEKAPANYTFIPFGLGPRICMGERLAYLEMRTFLLNAVKNFQFSFCEKTEGVKINPQVSLRPNKDIILSVKKR